ncbi:MAG: gamma-glutamyltransferase [Thermomicrobiales bacterium]
MAWPNRGVAHRPVAMGTRGAVASAHPLASLAGMEILKSGGNAVDAALATAAALNVVEPYMSGIGGSGYMLVYSARERRLRVLDYVGPASRNASLSAFETENEKNHGPKSPLIPSAAAGWLTAHAEYGSLPLDTLFAPAIGYATQGVPLTVKNAYFYDMVYRAGNLTEMTRAVFMPDGRPPFAGEIIRQPKLAATYARVAREGKESFYRGALAKEIVESIQAQGGIIDTADLANYEPAWKEPIGVDYRGYSITCPPPHCSGWQYLQAFKMLEAIDLAEMGQNSLETLHTLAEVFKVAVADRIAYTTNPAIDLDVLLSDAYTSERRALVDARSAASVEGERYGGKRPAGSIEPGDPRQVLKECTTHFDVVDAEGNAVAVTQSLGDGFGSGVMAGETGLMLNNFGYWFDFDPDSPNVIGPNRNIEMCMAPAVIFRDDKLFMVIGTPGSFGILQTTPQMISNVIDHGYSIQAAIEAPRIKATIGTRLQIETRIPEAVRDGLTVLGHVLEPLGDWSPLVGGGQGIMIDPDTGAYCGGGDPRRDGYALAW